jgi:lactate permease
VTWQQVYLPLGGLGFSALVAALPLLTLLGLLGIFRVKAHWAALSGLLVALGVALLAYAMPVPLAVAAALYGMFYGLFPIGWIVTGAIFLFDVTVKTGQFEVLKGSIAGLVEDRRLQALLVAFCFGAFIEGAAGFGTPVAISAAMLIGLGFRPLQAATLALIGNTAPVAFGALGTPVITLAAVTGLPLDALTATVGRILTPFSLLIPFWLVWAMVGWRGMKEIWPACLVTGGTYALTQLAVSNLHGPWLVGIVGSLTSMVCLIFLLRVWHPRQPWRFPEEEPSLPLQGRTSRRDLFRAWLPWLLLVVMVFLWGLPPVKAALNSLSAPIFAVPSLHQAVQSMPPVAPVPKAEDALFTLNWLSATGTSLFLTGVLSGLFLGLRPLPLLRVFVGTIRRVRFSLLTIALMLGLGFTTRYAGLEGTLGLALASTGALFPFFSPLLGWLGVAMTGSDTSSNVLFGNLQRITATQLGFSPILMAAANSAGGVMGKMVDAQSIVVAGVVTGEQGKEGTILRTVFFHSLALAILVGLVVLALATLAKGWVPVPGSP